MLLTIMTTIVLKTYPHVFGALVSTITSSTIIPNPELFMLGIIWLVIRGRVVEFNTIAYGIHWMKLTRCAGACD